MPTVTLRPAWDIGWADDVYGLGNGTLLVSGASSMAGALSDDSDGSYLWFNPNAFTYPVANDNPRAFVGMQTSVIPVSNVIKYLVIRARAAQPAAAFSATIHVGFATSNAAVYLVSSQGNPQPPIEPTGLQSTPLTFASSPIYTTPTNSQGYYSGSYWTQADLDKLTVSIGYHPYTGAPQAIQVYEVYVDVTYAAPPTVAVNGPTGTATVSNPTVSWAYTQGADGSGQTAFRVKVFTAAQYGAGGFNPATSIPSWDSGVVSGAAASKQIGVLLGNATFRAYVQVAQVTSGVTQWSAWSFSQFAVSVVGPGAPTVTAVADTALGALDVTVVEGAAPAWDSVQVQRSIDGGVTWIDLRDYTQHVVFTGTPPPPTPAGQIKVAQVAVLRLSGAQVGAQITIAQVAVLNLSGVSSQSSGFIKTAQVAVLRLSGASTSISGGGGGGFVPGARPFASSSPWNTPTPGGTSWFDTPLLHIYPGGGADQFRHWWVAATSAIVWYGAPTDPLWTFNMPDYIAPAWNRNRPAATFQRRAPANMLDGGDSDHILVLIDTATGDYVEVWNSTVNQGGRTVTGTAWATGNALTGPGAGTLGGLNDGVRASNFSWAGGLITGHDLAASTIDHALVLSLNSDTLKGGNGGPTPYRAPATCADAGPWTGLIIMGSRIGVPAGVSQPSGLSAIGVKVFNALKTYGAFVGDYAGGSWPVFYSDKNTVTNADVAPLYEFWNYGGSADMEKIGPLLRVADYQP